MNHATTYDGRTVHEMDEIEWKFDAQSEMAADRDRDAADEFDDDLAESY